MRKLKYVFSAVHGVDLEGDSGQIASPMYPRPFIQYGQYKWTITVTIKKVVRITFSSFYTDKFQSDFCSVYLQVCCTLILIIRFYSF